MIGLHWYSILNNWRLKNMKKEFFILSLIPIVFLITIILSVITSGLTLIIISDNFSIPILLHLILVCGIFILLSQFKKYSINKLHISSTEFIVCAELPSIFVSIIALFKNINTSTNDKPFVEFFETSIFFSWVLCSVLIFIITIIIDFIIYIKRNQKNEQRK